MSGRAFHDFYAPVDGVAKRFTLGCTGGVPVFLAAMEPIGKGEAAEKLYQGMDLVNRLLKGGCGWAAMVSQGKRNGNLAAVIEAAESRRAEIYGPIEWAAP